MAAVLAARHAARRRARSGCDWSRSGCSATLGGVVDRADGRPRTRCARDSRRSPTRRRRTRRRWTSASSSTSSAKLFSIGYQQGTHALDRSYYDLLASEARLASFVAIAKNDVPVDHWFRLGRTLTHAAGETALVSWSGSMFEYLMPALVMQSFPSHRARPDLPAARSGARSRTAPSAACPWGMSESAYNLRDRHLTYQYRAFGVPDLALKRGLGRDLVIAPYASALAAMVEPSAALANLAALEQHGALGPFGFRDALDYTRPDPGQTLRGRAAPTWRTTSA